MIQPTLPDDIAENALLRAAMRAASVIAGAIHIGFLALFLWLDLPLLALLNLGSIGTFVATWRLFGAGRINFALTLMSAEIVVHAGAAVVTLGLDSGFHYYLLALVGPLAVAMRASPALRVLGVIGIAVAFQALSLLLHRHPRTALPPLLLAVLSTLNVGGTVVIMAFVAVYYARVVGKSQAALRVLATTDPLTGLCNRRQLLDSARRWDGDAHDAPANRCVLLCDIDHFKSVNDRYGHDTGDQALQFVAKLLSGALRPGDSVARWGGEEFVAVLCNADEETALRTAERLRRAVEFAPFPVPGANGQVSALPLTITVGVALIGEAEAVEAAINRADAALYRGKSDGRNCVRQLGELAHA